jgi:pyruvate formate lyase activating enzyme
MINKEKGLVFHIQRFVLHDGPGIRTTIFLKGCPLRCPWCHNPEGLERFPELIYSASRCMACGTCAETCPEKAISLIDGAIIINRSDCTLCFDCIKVCNTNALEICGELMTTDEILDEALSDAEFYQQSGGGITISGGEPLMQFEFLLNLLKKAKQKNLHVCLDTTGYINTEKLGKVIQFIDIFLYDIKTLDKARHKKLTGVSNEIIIENLKFCINQNKDIIVRIPIVYGYNFVDVEQEIRDQIKWLVEMGIKKIELIPYHKFGEQKYIMLGKNYTLNLKSLDMDKIQDFATRLKERYNIELKLSTPILT